MSESTPQPTPEQQPSQQPAPQQPAQPAPQQQAQPQQQPQQPGHPHDHFGLDHGGHPGEDAEVVYFEGSPRLRSELPMITISWILGLAIIVGSIYAMVVWSWAQTFWMAIPIVIGIAVFFVPMLKVWRIRYRITNYRIDYQRGLLTTHIDTLELWHVNDVDFRQSLFERLLGVGSVRVHSSDKTMPELHMKGLSNPRPLFDSLKNRVIAVKRQRGVIKMDMGG